MSDATKHTLRLFNRSHSFSEGFGSLLDFSSLISNYDTDKSDDEADINSLRADWLAIATDMWNAIREHERSTTNK